MNSHITFEHFLNTSFEKRCQRNANYSLRAFARDLGVSSSNLSKAMKGVRGFSKATLEHISSRLGLNKEEAQFFISLCEKKFGKSKKSKVEATEKLKQALLYNVKIADDKVALISDWYHMAVLALMDTYDFQSDTKWIADQLLIHEKVAQKAIERLISLGAVKEQDGKYISTGNLYIDPQGIPSSAVKEFHHQIIKKADESIDVQNLENRDIASVVFAFDKDKMKAAKSKIKKFREEFEIEFGPNKNATNQEVYALGIQFFQLTKFKENKNKENL